MIRCDTNIDAALHARRQMRALRAGARMCDFLLNPYRFGSGDGGGGEGPPTNDPNWTDVQLLLHFDGVDGGTTFSDSSSFARAVSAVAGSPTTSATKVQYGPTAGRLNAQSLQVGVAADWSWMHQAGAIWTWEGWYAFDNFATDNVLFSTSNGSTANHGLYCAVTTNRGFALQIYNGSGNAGSSTYVNNALCNGSVPNDTNYHHIAIEWDEAAGANNLQIFVDGVSATTGTKANPPSASGATAALKLGGFSTVGAFAGYADEVRLTKNALRYTSAFTPVGPFPETA